LLTKLVQGLFPIWRSGDLEIWRREWHVPTASALPQAWQRLDSESLRDLFERIAQPEAAHWRWLAYALVISNAAVGC
jgi:hypothetical protein